MQTSPRPATIVTAATGLVLAALGIAANRPEPALAGAAFLAAVAWGLSSTRSDIARARRAGFEMVWRESNRRSRMLVGETRVFVAELRNRSDRIVHVDGIRAVSSECLRAEVRPSELDVLPQGFARLEVHVTARRVGRHGLHGLSLQASGVGAAFEIPLTFANVLGVEVVPRSVASGLKPPRGGRLRADPAAGRPRNRHGEGSELREIRELQAGDSFRKIAWKSSARRGRLMVRELDVEEREVVWVVVDVSPDHLLGPVGDAPFDRAIELGAAFTLERAREGAAVGVTLTTDHVVDWSPPVRGGADVGRLEALWLDANAQCGMDRCGLSIDELLRLAVEHARPLDPASLGDLPRGDVDRLLGRLDFLRSRAPFQLAPPLAGPTHEQRDRAVRHYVASFGLDVPGRQVGGTRMAGIVEALRRLQRVRPRPTDLVVVAPAPPEHGIDDLRAATAALRARGVRVRWAIVDARSGLSLPSGGEAVAQAVALQLLDHERRGKSALARLGIRPLAPRPPREERTDVEAPEPRTIAR